MDRRRSRSWSTSPSISAAPSSTSSATIYWARRRRQQDAEAGVSRRRRAGAGLRYADHRRRGAVEPLPPHARGGGEGRAEVPARARAARAGLVRSGRERQQFSLSICWALKTSSFINAGDDLNAAMQKIADKLKAEGRKGYIIPGGGSNALGALGYVACAQEISGAVFRAGLASRPHRRRQRQRGHACRAAVGLQAGTPTFPSPASTCAVRARSRKATCTRSRWRRRQLLGDRRAEARATSRALDEWVGPGYSLPTPEMVEAVKLFARLEGVLLDPVYTGKAAAGLIALAQRGAFKKGENVLFVHTGGAPALYAYQKTSAI